MYLPQYHPIPENNEWWGEGFTEWTNVRKAEPRFPGHHQPHLPERLGYYDLRLPEARRAQADLAQEYGIYGFCYYHYWFNGKRLLEFPFNEVLKTGEPRFPFCLCWANENWSRRWDGSDKHILMAQNYTDADSIDFINSLIPAFRDERYIRVNEKPLLLLYRTGLLPDAKRTAGIWRAEMIKAGIGDLYLVRVENHMDGVDPTPEETGFDAAMEFAPFWGSLGERIGNLKEVGLPTCLLSEDLRVYDYLQCMKNMLARPVPTYKLFKGVFPGWDNSARRKKDPLLFANSSPDCYAFWLSQIARYTLENFAGDERLVFINAWNEWGEGCHLEPDDKYGVKYLEATRLALRLAQDVHDAFSQIQPSTPTLPFSSEKWYELLSKSYQGSEPLSPDKLNLLSSFGPHALYAMLPLMEPQIQNQFSSILKCKDQELNDLYNSLSWKITAPLRKIYDIFSK
jgi:lipopolysaccharide biosynthesis protein